jgi:uncharacterized protein (DUF952 family)
VSDSVYRICSASDWTRTTKEGQLPLTPIDERDGYVHLSSAAQVPGSLRRFFAGREDLVLLSISCERLGEGELRYEPGGDQGELFPHVYGIIGLAAIFEAAPLRLDEDGQHRLPPALVRAIEAADAGADGS